MKLALSHDCLVVFIDETGHELLSDPIQKVFGLGGCAIMASRLENDLRAPWCKVREVVGGKANAQLHAAEITTPTSEQIDAVSSFFRLHPFARFGAICSVETSLDEDISPVMAVAGALTNRLTDILRWQPFGGVELIFEHSERLAPILERVFSDFQIQESGKEIPLGLSWMVKSSGEPGLEVADFLANAIGAEVRHRLAGRQGHAKNFEAFFHNQDPRLVSFMDIRRVHRNGASGI